AVQSGHPQVHDHDVGLQLLGQGQALGAVRGLGHDLDPRLGREHAPQAAARDLLVVRDEDADALHAHVSGHGSVALTTVPPPSGLSTTSVPPTSRALPRIETRPRPACGASSAPGAPPRDAPPPDAPPRDAPPPDAPPRDAPPSGRPRKPRPPSRTSSSR